MTCQLSPLTFWPDTRDLTSGASKAGYRAPPDYRVLNVGRRDSLHTGWTALVLEETSAPPGRSTFHCLRRFHIKVHLFKRRMTLLNTEDTCVTLKWTSRVIDKLLTTIRKSAAVLPFKSRRRTDCRSFTSRSSQTSQLFPGNPERRADVRRGLRAEIICDRDP